MADIKSHLVKDGHSFNFFQAISLLEEFFTKKDSLHNPLESGQIRLTPSASLVFPPNDIARIREQKDFMEIMLTFMGLVGVSSPLPLYFTEYIARHEDNGIALRDFLAIFNHRMYTLFYRAWKKYRFTSIATNGQQNPILSRIAACAGINPSLLSDPFYTKILSYSGCFSGKTRSKEALRCIVSDFFDAIPVTIKEWQPRYTEILNPPRLGIDSCLGTNAIAGTTKWDISGKFRVSLGPLAREQFETFLPATDNIKSLKKLITFFINEPLDYDIEVKLESSELVPVILGQNNTRLGETSSLGTSQEKSAVQAIIIS
jgi:type VI secretion system protein ImpH